MRKAENLIIFNPPLNDEIILFSDGSQWQLRQDNSGWILTAPGTWQKKPNFPDVGFNMSALLYEIGQLENNL